AAVVADDARPLLGDLQRVADGDGLGVDVRGEGERLLEIGVGEEEAEGLDAAEERPRDRRQHRHQEDELAPGHVRQPVEAATRGVVRVQAHGCLRRRLWTPREGAEAWVILPMPGWDRN